MSTPAASAPKLQRDPERIARSWTAFRQTDTNPNLPVLWRPASAKLPLRQDPGRWNVLGGEYAQYFSLSEEAAWAEYIRGGEIQTAQRALSTVRRMWVARVHETDIADLSTRGKAQECGLDPPELLVGDYTPCQQLAVELQARGYRGVLSPCAALDAATNLTLWGPRIDEQLLPADHFSNFTGDREIIEAKIFRSASPPPGDLVDRTRQRRTTPDTYRWE